MMYESPSQDQSNLVDEFMRHYGRHQRQLFLYIFSLLPNVNDAEELLQQTNFILWKKFSEFRPGSNFMAWGSRVAYLEVLKYYEARKKLAQPFDPRFFEVVSEKMRENADYFEKETIALHFCMEKLNQSEQELLRLCYSEGADVKSVATMLRKSASSVYKTLGKIREALLNCISLQLNQEEMT
jgi:RNA polymerase sigma-70 factor, ECF subfamily